MLPSGCCRRDDAAGLLVIDVAEWWFVVEHDVPSVKAVFAAVGDHVPDLPSADVGPVSVRDRRCGQQERTPAAIDTDDLGVGFDRVSDCIHSTSVAGTGCTCHRRRVGTCEWSQENWGVDDWCRQRVAQRDPPPNVCARQCSTLWDQPM